jgi:hypothetical protein
MLVRFILWLLKGKRLTLTERQELSTAILDRLDALPLRAIVEISDEGVLINGQQVDIDKLRVLRESAIAALDNKAFNFIGEQVVWLAVQNVVHKSTTPEQIYYYRAAIWFSEQMKQHLQILAQHGQELPLSEDYKQL